MSFSSLDTELANIATAIASVIVALAEVRRSDGGVQNGVVTYDSLDEALQQLIGGSEEGILPSDLSDAAFASQTEAEAGVVDDKLMTPLRTKQASGDSSGAVTRSTSWDRSESRARRSARHPLSRRCRHHPDKTH